MTSVRRLQPGTAVSTGGGTPLSGIACGCALFGYILFCGSIIEKIPIAALTGVMLVLLEMFDFTSFARLGQVRSFRRLVEALHVQRSCSLAIVDAISSARLGWTCAQRLVLVVHALTGVLFVLVLEFFDFTSFARRCLQSCVRLQVPRTDAAVLLLVTGVTYATNLAVAVLAGVVLASLSFSWKSAQVHRPKYLIASVFCLRCIAARDALCLHICSQCTQVCHRSRDATCQARVLCSRHCFLCVSVPHLCLQLQIARSACPRWTTQTSTLPAPQKTPCLPRSAA
jgi:hypothetical protein